MLLVLEGKLSCKRQVEDWLATSLFSVVTCMPHALNGTRLSRCRRVVSAEWVVRRQRFLDVLAEKQDVWVVSNREVIQWMQKPVPLGQINAMEEWKCGKQVGTGGCQWKIDHSEACWCALKIQYQAAIIGCVDFDTPLEVFTTLWVKKIDFLTVHACGVLP